jgi:hypothetical protein
LPDAAVSGSYRYHFSCRAGEFDLSISSVCFLSEEVVVEEKLIFTPRMENTLNSRSMLALAGLASRREYVC